MRIRRTSQRLAVAALIALAVTALPSCGGGSDGGGGGTTTPTATFTAENPSPGTSTIAMLPGASAGAAFNVRITVTGVNDFFGAAFRVTYDPVALLFNGMDDSGSLLRQGGTANVFFQANQNAVPGQIIITATRLDPSDPNGGTVDVGPTADLVVLNFSARRAIAAGDAGGVLAFDAAKDVQVCGTPTTCASAAGLTWSAGAATAQ